MGKKLGLEVTQQCEAVLSFLRREEPAGVIARQDNPTPLVTPPAIPNASPIICIGPSWFAHKAPNSVARLSPTEPWRRLHAAKTLNSLARRKERNHERNTTQTHAV